MYIKVFVYFTILSSIWILKKFSLLSNWRRSQNCVHVVSDGNASIRKCYKRAWNSANVWFCAKESLFAGNFTALLYFKKSAAEAHRILVETYSDHTLSETTCRDWFRSFKNNDFYVENKEHSAAPKKFEDEELETLLHEYSCQTHAERAESLGVDHTTVLECLKTFKTKDIGCRTS